MKISNCNSRGQIALQVRNPQLPILGSSWSQGITKFFLIFLLVFSSQAFAQTPSGTTSGDGDPMSSLSGTRKQIATIVFAGLAGAVMGLSTLSFYGRPQDKLSNIAVGFAVGVIIGTGYTTYKAATKPREMYDSKLENLILPFEKGVLFSEQNSPQWEQSGRTVAKGLPAVLGYTWSFE